MSINDNSERFLDNILMNVFVIIVNKNGYFKCEIFFYLPDFPVSQLKLYSKYNLNLSL